MNHMLKHDWAWHKAGIHLIIVTTIVSKKWTYGEAIELVKEVSWNTTQFSMPKS